MVSSYRPFWETGQWPPGLSVSSMSPFPSSLAPKPGSQHFNIPGFLSGGRFPPATAPPVALPPGPAEREHFGLSYPTDGRLWPPENIPALPAGGGEETGHCTGGIASPHGFPA